MTRIVFRLHSCSHSIQFTQTLGCIHLPLSRRRSKSRWATNPKGLGSNCCCFVSWSMYVLRIRCIPLQIVLFLSFVLPTNNTDNGTDRCHRWPPRTATWRSTTGSTLRTPFPPPRRTSRDFGRRIGTLARGKNGRGGRTARTGQATPPQPQPQPQPWCLPVLRSSVYALGLTMVVVVMVFCDAAACMVYSFQLLFDTPYISCVFVCSVTTAVFFLFS